MNIILTADFTSKLVKRQHGQKQKLMIIWRSQTANKRRALTEHLINDIHGNTEAYDCSVNQEF